MGWRERAEVLKLPSDLAGRIALLRLATGTAKQPVDVRLKALGGNAVRLRPDTTDFENLVEGVIAGYAQPPAEATDLKTIVEIGTNIGIGLAVLAARHPHARVYGVEADRDNFALARHNLAPSDATLLHAAAWDEETTVTLAGPRESGRAARTGGSTPAHTLTTLLNRLVGPDTPVDYLYLDIEGAHERVLKAPDTRWAQRVRTIKVAGHAGTPYDEHACAADLQRLGFRTRVVPYDPIGWTIGFTARPQTDTSNS
jgi:FkbM family methyltransferase